MRLIMMGAGVLAAATVAAAQDPAPRPEGTTGTASTGATAGARLMDSQQRAVGEARLRQTPHGVLLVLELTNATPGVHGLHLHETGACEPPSFESAGGHFAPGGTEHGVLNPRGPHPGDLPNIHVPSTMELTVEYFIADVTLDPGARSLFDRDGTAIVIHADPDDYETDPAGNAGDRLACGVIAH